jgi:GNAT superfamily N-acetyltransferase
MKDLRIIRGEPQHAKLFPECLSLLERTQGRNVFTLEYLERCASEGNRVLFIALVSGEIAGVATARVLGTEEFAHYAPFGPDVAVLFRQNRVGSFETASVRELMQGKGVGQELGRHRIDWLKRMGCHAVVGVSWESGLPHVSNRVFEKLGFRRMSRAENFYGEHSIRRGIVCPVCGEPPCRCSAALYVLNLLETRTGPNGAGQPP